MIALIYALNWIDLSMITFILLSVIVSFFHGFIEELFSFLAWFFAFIIAFLFLDEWANLLIILVPKYMDLRLVVAFISLFLFSFILIEWINYLIINSLGGRFYLSLLNRFVATIFGFARSMVIIVAIIFLLGLSYLPTKIEWQQSILITNIKPIVVKLRSYLPFEVAIQFNFEPPPEWTSFSSY
ncbi:MAG: CvpA family protein [Thiomargarita sp.]|nr:CvpA family protein [Thiomargarita sp.]